MYFLGDYHNYDNMCLIIGILCGSCPVGYAVSSLLNRCVKCTNILALLLAALGNNITLVKKFIHASMIYWQHYIYASFEFLIAVIADLVIAAALVWIDKPLPMWLYPCLYFVQVSHLH